MASPRGIFVTVPTLVLSLLGAAIFLFFLFFCLSSCDCPAPPSIATTSSDGGRSAERTKTSTDDIAWVRDQIRLNGLHMADNVLRKGINPRTRAQQLEDLIKIFIVNYDRRRLDMMNDEIDRNSFRIISYCVPCCLMFTRCFDLLLYSFKGISHYEDSESSNHTALPCPGELLVEEHHSNYGEPWAGGRDVFEFLAEASHLKPGSRVLEIGCGTLRVGLHFIRYLEPGHFHCLERDELSLMAAFRYELPSQGLLYKRPLIVHGEDMDFTKFGSDAVYDLIYASAVFLHMPDKLVWVGLERLASNLRPYEGRIFVSHNVKFCSRLGGEECTRRLASLGLEYVGKQTHDSLLFNHYEIWFEFRRSKA